MITDKDKAIELVSKDWSEYFNLAEDLREHEEILNIVLRADDLFANGPRYFHHLFWRDDRRINEINLIGYEDVLTLVEEAQDNFQDNLDFPDSNIPAYLMSEDEIVERYNLHIEIDDFDGEFMDEVGTDEAENIRERLELVIDDRVYSSLRRYFADERVNNYIALDPQNPSTDPKQIMAACLIHISNLFLAPKEFFTEKNLCEIFEEHHKALSGIPIQMCWQSDMEKLLSHINSFLPFKDLGNDSQLIQIIAKNEKYTSYLSKIITLPADISKKEKSNEKLPEDYSDEELIEHYNQNPHRASADFDKLSEERRNNRAIALAAVSWHGHHLEKCNEGFQADKEFVLAAVKYNGSCFQYASADLQNNREFLKECLKLSGYTICFVSNKDFLNDKELILLAIDNYDSPHEIIKKASDHIKSDPEVILAGVKKQAGCLSHASESLHNDQKFIFECVKIDGCCLSSIKNQEFLNDRDIVTTALDNLCDDVVQWDSYANGIADKICDEFKKDRNIADKILNANPCTISYFPHFDYTKEEILGFVRKNSNTYYQLDESYKKDPDVISCAIEKNASIYERLSEEHQQNKYFALKAIKLNSLLYVSLPSELKEDEEIINFILDNPIKR